MKWKAEEVAVIVSNEYFFSTCFVNESLFLLIGWTYLLGSARAHAHTFSTSQTEFSQFLCTCKGQTALGTRDSVLCLMPLGQASSQLRVRMEHSVVAVQSSSSVYVLCWETQNSSYTHTPPHPPPPPRRVFLAKYFCSCHLQVQSEIQLFHWLCLLLTICARFWDS